MTLVRQQPSGHEPPDVNEKPCWCCNDDGMTTIVSVKDCTGRMHELPWVKDQPEMPCPVCRLGMVL